MSVQERVKAISRNTGLTINQRATTAKIELCGMCTLNCRFCVHKEMKAKGIRQKMMTMDDLKLVLKWLKKYRPDVKEVGLFYMGESGMNPILPEAYALLKENGYFTYLTTNGTVIDNILPAIPFIDSLKVSWNYKDLDDFEDKTGMSAPTFAKIVVNIEILHRVCHEDGKPFAISTVLDGAKEDYSRWIDALPYDEHYWIPLQTQGGAYEEGQDGVIGESESSVKPLPCWSLFKGVYVDVDLNVRTCCYGHKKEHIIGNLRNDNWAAIPDFNRKARELHLAGKIPVMCQRCLRNQ